MNFPQILIGVGSNLGDRLLTMQKAASLINVAIGPVLKAAPLYETYPMGAADLFFYNSVLLVHTEFAPEIIMEKLLSIETDLGRERKVHWGNRSIDLDILLYKPTEDLKTLELSLPIVTIPHPFMLERDFVMVPAAEIAGNWKHPKSNLSLEKELQNRGFKIEIVKTKWLDDLSLP